MNGIQRVLLQGYRSRNVMNVLPKYANYTTTCHQTLQARNHDKVSFFSESDSNQEEYVAQQFGYRVVLPSMDSIHDYHPGFKADFIGCDGLDYPIGTNLDILQSPEVRAILASKNKS